MPDSLAQLEEQKTELFRQIADLGDFRRGSITHHLRQMWQAHLSLCPAP